MAGRALTAVIAMAWAATLAAHTNPPVSLEPHAAVQQTSSHSAADLFQTSNTCIVCHNNLVTPSGENVSIGSDWRASMMANSARDPYWLASVRREVIDHPEARAEIEDECSICHMPALTYTARAGGGTGRIFAMFDENGGPPDDPLAADGVSCAICHQIGPERLGTPESFTGGYVIDTTRPRGERTMFGPFEMDSGRTALMRSATGFVPTQTTHVQSSELCATCHTLVTTALDGSGLNRLPEQMPYVEWQNSAFAGTQSCQDCHMPAVEEPTPISGVLGQPRDGVSRHVFRGGNFFMMRMLNRYRDELGVVASPEEMEAGIRRTISHLEDDTARLTIERATVAGGRLDAEVSIANLAGHKLPTAYPSRRAWLQFTVRTPDGRIIFESGALQPNGSITGNDADADDGRFEPHYAEISGADQVQIYESVMEDGDGRPTTGLLSGVRYAKDNRILPDGFQKQSAPADIAVRGAAADDDDFDAGGDRVRYAVDLGSVTGPVEVTVQLWYQPIGYRWAENLRGYDSAETRRFVRYYDSMAGVSAVVLQRRSLTVGTQ